MDINNIINSVIADQLSKSASQKINIPEDKSRDVVNMAVPLLVAGLAKNAKNPKEAKNISEAISKDHDGSILNDLSSVFLSGGREQEGEKIIEHILGKKVEPASKAIGNQVQVNPEQVKKVLSLVAPVVMGAIGSKQKTGGLDSSTLTDFLQETVTKKVSGSNQQDNLLTQILDQNKNGSVIDEIINFVLKLISGHSKKGR